MSAVPHSRPHPTQLAPVEEGRLDAVPLVRPSRWRDPSYQAYLLLRITFVALPLAMGIDKFFNSMVYWPSYLAGWVDGIVPGTAQQMMYGVGVVEIVAGVLVALKPRYAAYVVSAWLLGIVVNLFSSGNGFYDVGARDLALMGGALALACLARRFDAPLAIERRIHGRR